MMKKTLTILLFICVFSTLFTQETNTETKTETKEPLATALSGKKWDQLPPVFLDHSHKTLVNYFSNALGVNITASYPGLLAYEAKYPKQAEMGMITFEKKDGKYQKVEVKNQVKPMFFIRGFKKYRVSNLPLKVGDARIRFINGHFFEPLPSGPILFFRGQWQISIKPKDAEEQLTLKRKFKKDYFEETNNAGIFILDKKIKLKALTPEGETALNEIDSELQPLFDLYRKTYGVNVEHFGEEWYLPFSQGSNLVIFEKGKKAFYYYSYDQGMVPDTQLTDSSTNAMILSYNSHKGMKLQFGGGTRVSQLDLNLYFDPRQNLISGTTSISYDSPAGIRNLALDKELRVVRNLTADSRGLNFFRRGKTYYIMGEDMKTLSLYYRGRIVPMVENLELFKPRLEPVRQIPGTENNLFYFLDRNQDYYPNPGDEFFKTRVVVKLPVGLNCLGSGIRTEIPTEGASVFEFSSPGTKGVSLVAGNFSLDKTLTTRIPLHLYTYESFKFPRKLDLAEIKDAFDFFIERFGPLDISAVNVLLKRGQVEGGVSNNGFIVIQIPPDRTQMSGIEIRGLDSSVDKKILSPVLLRDSTEDHFMHELAHQWWGGVISWKSYRDVWLTEGLAHFSVLYYLKSRLPDKAFNRIAKKLKRWVHRWSDSGPIIYGTRINLLEEKFEAYQSMIYSKSALVLLTLMDLIGEDEFLKRLKSVVEKYKYRSLSSLQFTREFSGKNRMISDFFKKWIYERAIPEVQLALDEDAKEMDRKEFKRVVLRVTQTDTDFIFPLPLKVTTRKGSSIESVIVKSKKQEFVIHRDSTIKSIDVADWVYLIKEKKQPPPYFQLQKKDP